MAQSLCEIFYEKGCIFPNERIYAANLYDLFETNYVSVCVPKDSKFKFYPIGKNGYIFSASSSVEWEEILEPINYLGMDIFPGSTDEDGAIPPQEEMGPRKFHVMRLLNKALCEAAIVPKVVEDDIKLIKNELGHVIGLKEGHKFPLTFYTIYGLTVPALPFIDITNRTDVSGRTVWTVTEDGIPIGVAVLQYEYDEYDDENPCMSLVKFSTNRLEKCVTCGEMNVAFGSMKKQDLCDLV